MELAAFSTHRMVIGQRTPPGVKAYAPAVTAHLNGVRSSSNPKPSQSREKW